MGIIRKTNILIKTERRFVVRQAGEVPRIWCDQCAGQMITAREAAGLHGIGTRGVYRLIEEGKVHFAETAAEMYVCPNFAAPVLPAD